MKSPALKSHAHDHLAECERGHGASVTALAAAEMALTRATGAYNAALSQGRDVALTARRAQGDAEVDRDIARHAVDTAFARLETAQAAAAAAEIERLAAVARSRISEFEATTIRDYRAVVISVRRMMRLAAEAEIARDAAIRGGVSEFDLPEVEGFRAVPALPRVVIETKRVLCAVHPRTGDAIPDHLSRPFRSGDLGPNALILGSDTPDFDRAYFDRSVVLDAKRGPLFESLLATLTIPGLMADDVAGWTPPDSMDPHTVLARLDALESVAPPDRSDRRERRIEMRRVPDAERVASAE